MKRFFAVLGGLLVLPAFAEVAPVYYDEVIGYEDAETPSSEDVSVVESDTVVVPVAQPSVARRTTASRVVPTATNAAATRSVASGRVVASTRGATGAVTARGAANARAVSSRATVARSGANSTVSTRRAVGTAPTTAARASIVQTDTVNKSLYSGSRVGQRAAAIRARSPITTSIDSGVATVSVSDAVSMDELAQVTDFCKAQYTSCMDNYCNVLDDNQGRCSCSKNIKNYEKTENALKDATAALQDIAQQIQYIGLTGDQVETLFAQTEAELSLSSASDSSQIKSDLDRIKDLIVEVKSGTASSTAVSNGISMDFAGLLDFSFDSFGIDMSTFFGGAGTGNTSSISNQRGEQLYKTAAARCKAAVLNDCSAQGVDIAVITNSYDLEIDKQCLVYERSLKEANDNMSNTVRNAKNVLQRARLMVAQNKNAYDLRGCINALDSCMQDDYVCGAEYEYCLDPSGKHIVQGELVLGSTSDLATDMNDMWDYSGDSGNANAWGANGTLSEYIDNSMLTENDLEDTQTDNIAKYLQQKIGYIQDGKAYGMCASVLNQCQDYTYNNDKSKREYNFNNQVVKTYLERTLVQIKAAQDEILGDYAQNCIADVKDCLADNGWNSNSSTVVSAVAVNACKGVITTCRDLSNSTSGSDLNWVNEYIKGGKTCSIEAIRVAGSLLSSGHGVKSVSGYAPLTGYKVCAQSDVNSDNSSCTTVGDYDIDNPLYDWTQCTVVCEEPGKVIDWAQKKCVWPNDEGNACETSFFAQGDWVDGRCDCGDGVWFYSQKSKQGLCVADDEELEQMQICDESDVASVDFYDGVCRCNEDEQSTSCDAENGCDC